LLTTSSEPWSIYDDYYDRMESLRTQMYEDVSSYPKPISKIGLAYLQRTYLMPGMKLAGGPLPYMPFWLEEDFDAPDKYTVAEKLALGLAYISLSLTVKDDFLDNNNQDTNAIILSNIFLTKFIKIHESIFPKNSIFWNIFAKSLAEWYDGETWEHTSDLYNTTSLSEEFLSTSSNKLSMNTVPTLSAFPILGKEESKIKSLVDMIRYYAIGFKLIDDLADWQLDLKKKNYNCSSLILLYSLYSNQNGSHNQIREDQISSLMLTSDIVERVYSTAYDYFQKSLQSLGTIRATKLRMLIEGRMRSTLDLYNAAANTRKDTLTQLNSLIKSHTKSSTDNEIIWSD